MTDEEKTAAIADWKASGKSASSYLSGLRNSNIDKHRLMEIGDVLLAAVSEQTLDKIMAATDKYDQLADAETVSRFPRWHPPHTAITRRLSQVPTDELKRTLRILTREIERRENPS